MQKSHNSAQSASVGIWAADDCGLLHGDARRPDGRSPFADFTGDESLQIVSDGYLIMALLKHRLDGSAPVGLNHFGFVVENNEEIARRTKEVGLEEPKKRPADRPYAEFRACDPEGNFFDVSQHGFEVVQTEAERAKKKEHA
jgi:hypothetical protein